MINSYMKLAGLYLLRFYLRNQLNIAYFLGIFFGWILCSEYQIYLETGRITWWPWD
jgi:hypothetical protein